MESKDDVPADDGLSIAIRHALQRLATVPAVSWAAGRAGVRRFRRPPQLQK